MNVSAVPSLLRAGEPLATARTLAVLVHGRGSSGRDMLGLANHLASPGVAWVAPSASHGSWYPQRFLAPRADNEPWLSAALQTLNLTVAEARTAGFATDRIALIGFSQGACLVLDYAAQSPARYGLVAGLSGALIGPLDQPRPPFDLAGTPMLLGCATQDAHIPFEHFEASAARFAASGAVVTRQVFPGAAHTVFPQEVDWLQGQLAAL